MVWLEESPWHKRKLNPGSAAFEEDALTTSPTRWLSTRATWTVHISVSHVHVWRLSGRLGRSHGVLQRLRVEGGRDRVLGLRVCSQLLTRRLHQRGLLQGLDRHRRDVLHQHPQARPRGRPGPPLRVISPNEDVLRRRVFQLRRESHSLMAARGMLSKGRGNWVKATAFDKIESWPPPPPPPLKYSYRFGNGDKTEGNLPIKRTKKCNNNRNFTDIKMFADSSNIQEKRFKIDTSSVETGKHQL